MTDKIKAEITATINELNEYLLGNRTNKKVSDTLTKLQENITEYGLYCFRQQFGG